MANFLNLGNEKFLKNLKTEIYVDKSNIIKETNRLIGTSNCYMCITRPRRFGKTMALSMLRAYYTKGYDSNELFKELKISQDSSYLEHLNKYNTITIDMAEVGTSLKDKTIILDVITEKLIKDLKEKYPNVITDETTCLDALITVYNKTKETFIFLIDEWDYIYRECDKNKKLCDEYTDFLRSLFKGERVSSAIDLVYMTGILPIKRYNSQSALNNFIEYNMLNPRNLGEFIGFTEEEVENLCQKYNMDIENMKQWYNGYHYKKVGNIYNPKSVVEAITLGEYGDYWISTSAIESIIDYMNYDNGELKNEVMNLISGKKVELDVTEFENDLTQVNSKDAALTVLIHLGYLAYDIENKSCYIPNYEIRTELEKAVKKLKWEEIYNPLYNSKKLLEETRLLNTKYIEESLDRNLIELTTVFNRLNENVLSVILNISYNYARKEYVFLKEVNSGIGRADLILLPLNKEKETIILELKVDRSAEEALNQIKEKDYQEIKKDRKGKTILVGINLDSNTKKHQVLIDVVNN